MNVFKQSMRQRGWILGALALSLFLIHNSYGAETTAPVQKNEEAIDTLTQQKINIFRGDLVELKVYGMTRIAIVDPGIIEIINADVNKLLVAGSVEGETSVFIWDSKGKRRFEVQVISKDLDYTMARMKKLFDASKITGIKLEKNDLEGKLVASGKILKEKKDSFNSIMDKFGDQVINLVTDDATLIEVDVQITELSTTLNKVLGLDWSKALNYTETLPTFQGNLGDWFRIGDFARTTAITAAVNLLISEGKGRVLSKPNVVVTNGEDATFLVGGEIPISTTTSTGQSVSQNISYKSYGVDLTVTPTIKADKIDVTLSVAIRDIDSSNSVSGSTAFTTRSADTKLLLQDGQTIVLAGLIKQNTSESVSRVPFISKIPVIGLLFRNKATPYTDIEVVISLTPRILKEKTPMEIKEEKKGAALAEAAEQETETEPAKAVGKSAEVPVEATVPALGKTEELKVSEVKSALEEKAPEGIVTQKEEKFPTVENVSQALTTYVQSVQKKIADAISFPYEAKEKGWEGAVTLNLKLLSDGKLEKVFVKESSGKEIFDKDAMNTAQIVAPFAPFPAEIDLEELEVTAPVVYSQKVILEGEATAQEKK